MTGALLAPLQQLPRLDGSARRILVVLRGGLPDAVLAQGLLGGLRLRHPSVQVHVTAPLKHAKSIQRHRSFAQVIPFPDGVGLQDADPWANPDLRRALNRIQELRFDAALAPSPQRDPLTDALVLASQAPLRIGWQSSHLLGGGEPDSAGWNAFYTHLLPTADAPYPEPERYRHFTSRLGLDPGPEALAWPGDANLAKAVQAKLSQAGWKGGPLVGVWFPPQSGTGFTRWGEVLGPVLDRGLGVVLLGPGGGRLALGGAGLDLRATLSIEEQFECMALCRVVMGTEGPWIYPCAARKIPQVILAGGGEFGRHAPVTDFATVVCHPLACYFCAWACDQGGHACLGGLPPEVVGEALRRALEAPSPRPSLVYRAPDPEGAIAPLDLESMLVPGSLDVVRMD